MGSVSEMDPVGSLCRDDVDASAVNNQVESKSTVKVIVMMTRRPDGDKAAGGIVSESSTCPKAAIVVFDWR